MPSERVTVLTVSGVAEVEVGQDLDWEVLRHVSVGVLALGGRARRQRLLAAGARDAKRPGM